MIWKEEEEAELPTICGHSQTMFELCSTSTAHKFTNKKEIKAIAPGKVLVRVVASGNPNNYLLLLLCFSVFGIKLNGVFLFNIF